MAISSMPGAFDTHIFRPPPRQPSFTGSLPSSSSSSLQTRKRSRACYQYSPSYSSSFLADDRARLPAVPSISTSTLASTVDPTAPSPCPLANSNYVFAGGLESSSLRLAEERDEMTDGADVGFRRCWQDDSSLEAVLENDRLLRSRAYFAHDGSGNAGWRSSLLRVVEGVAGRVMQFCKVGSFRGFFAGGGHGYAIDKNHSHQHFDSVFLDIAPDDSLDVFDARRKATPVPGQYPEEPLPSESYFVSSDCDADMPTRPAKKVQLDTSDGELRASWVMIDANHWKRPSSPARLSTRKVPRHRFRAHTPSRRSLASQCRSSRRPVLPYRRSPFASQLNSESQLQIQTPCTIASEEDAAYCEARQYAARLRQQEIEDDASMMRLNAQLKAMIKEGKEALGTKIEVFGDAENIGDDGFVDGDKIGADSSR